MHFLITAKCMGIFILVLKPADQTASLRNAHYSLHTSNNQCINQQWHFPKPLFALSSPLQAVNHQRSLLTVFLCSVINTQWHQMKLVPHTSLSQRSCSHKELVIKISNSLEIGGSPTPAVYQTGELLTQKHYDMKWARCSFVCKGPTEVLVKQEFHVGFAYLLPSQGENCSLSEPHQKPCVRPHTDTDV